MATITGTPRERTADSLETLMRERVRATLEGLVEEELAAALGADRSARVGTVRQGYRHGTRPRTLTTSLGPTTLAMPRARIHGAGTVSEWRSQLVPRYQRRTRRVDEALLGVYLAGTNTRRIKRRVKTQASLPSQDAVLLLLFGLLRSGAITLRALVGLFAALQVAWPDRAAAKMYRLAPCATRTSATEVARVVARPLHENGGIVAVPRARARNTGGIITVPDDG